VLIVGAFHRVVRRAGHGSGNGNGNGSMVIAVIAPLQFWGYKSNPAKSLGM
jgi:hypothetical protein